MFSINGLNIILIIALSISIPSLYCNPPDDSPSPGTPRRDLKN